MSDDEREPEYSDDSSDDEGDVEGEMFKHTVKTQQLKKTVQPYDEYEIDDDDYDSDINKKDDEEESETDDIDEDIDDYDMMDEQTQPTTETKKKVKYDTDDDDESENENEYEEDDGDLYLRRFDENTRKHIITDYYPELIQQNYDEVEAMCRVVRNDDGIIVDPLHRTLPFLTKYEKARILGERAKQINSGAKPVIEVDNTVIDGYLIALKELEEKKIPFIIKRPLPNGGCEYWKLEDLEMI
jgi:DNA-directed RNA polymerase subunit K/omega